MTAHVAGLFRHPIKGFSPEPVNRVTLRAGACFPCDRLFAVEDGPSGFDAAAPGWVSKMKFTVLARDAAVANIHTRYDEARGEVSASCTDGPSETFTLTSDVGRVAFADWLSHQFGPRFKGPLKVVETVGAHRFMDHPQGHVSLINAQSVRAIGEAAGQTVDPARFRGNVIIEEMEAWQEDAWDKDALVRIGEATLKVFKPIVRCKATHANPRTAAYDMDMVPLLFERFQRKTCGIYAHVVEGGSVSVGDPLVAA